PLTLIDGSMFVSCDKPSIVQTDVGAVYALKPALFNVSYNSGNMRVKSLSGLDAMTAVSGKQRLPIPSGTEALISDHTPSRGEVLSGDGIGRRKFGVYALSTGNVAVLNDYSIPMFLRSSANLNALRKSEATGDRQTLNRAMKLAVACELATMGRGGYQV